VTMPKITIYQKLTCTTCRQVYNALEESGVEFGAVDYQLCRYITRPAIANERLKRNRAGQVVLQLKSSYKDGTTHIVEPLEFMERLAALMPRLRLHLIRFHGVLAPNAKLRSKFVPVPAEHAPRAQARTLTRRVTCGGASLSSKAKASPCPLG
jgi:Putative transposase